MKLNFLLFSVFFLFPHFGLQAQKIGEKKVVRYFKFIEMIIPSNYKKNGNDLSYSFWYFIDMNTGDVYTYRGGIDKLREYDTQSKLLLKNFETFGEQKLVTGKDCCKLIGQVYSATLVYEEIMNEGDPSKEWIILKLRKEPQR